MNAGGAGSVLLNLARPLSLSGHKLWATNATSLPSGAQFGTLSGPFRASAPDRVEDPPRRLAYIGLPGSIPRAMIIIPLDILQSMQ